MTTGIQPARVAPMEVLKTTGDSQLAVVAVARFRGNDRLCAEMVDGLSPPLAREQKWIVNVSTQFGCPVGCPFCDAGTFFHGNLAAAEILAQVEWALDRHPGLAPSCRKLKVHLSRMGEPSLNDSVLSAMENLRGLARSDGLWCCLATVAPQERTAWFDQLLDIKERNFPGRFQLQFSVQSTRDTDRRRLIPIPHLSLHQLAALGARFHRPRDRRVVLNFALAQEVAFEPEVILNVFDPQVFAVKLTPINPTARGARSGLLTILRSPEEGRIQEATERLCSAGFDVVISVGDARENKIGSNCGQAVLQLSSQAALAEC